MRACIGVAPGETVLLAAEDPRHDYYDRAVVDAVADQARLLGAVPCILDCPVVEDPIDFPPQVREAMIASDHTIFFARLGDQVRFQALDGPGTKTMCYALDRHYLGSEFATQPYRGTVELKRLLESAMAAARSYTVTCPSGTRLTGYIPKHTDWTGDEAGEVRVKRFPLLTYRPVPAWRLSGRVALTKWLTGTGSRLYEPYELMLDETVFALVEDDRIVDFEGPAALVDGVRAHYSHVARRYAIERDQVHSWHTGFNPQTFFRGPAAENLMRWGGVAFGAPHYMHFHTCGAYAPGEICWSVFDPTIVFDGEPFWEEGRFTFLKRPEAREILARYPTLAAAYANPRRDIGV